MIGAKDGVELTGVTEVRWIAANAFVAFFADRDAVGFELSVVDVPATKNPVLGAIVGECLCRLMAASGVSLRLDHFSRFPAEGYGDVVYGTHPRASLQVDLLRAGVGRICRPCASISALVQAELEGTSLGAGSFSGTVAAVERSSSFLRQCTGVVVDVLRGDWCRVHVTDDSYVEEDSQPIKQDSSRDFGSCGVSPFHRSLKSTTLLVNLAAVACECPTSAAGFAATRTAQEVLFHCAVRLHIHSCVPSDKDLSNNTQEAEYHQLEHVKATVVLIKQRGAFLPLVSPLKRAAEQPIVLSRWQHQELVECELDAVNGDWSRWLLRRGLAKLKQCVYFSTPRPLNYLMLLGDIERLAVDVSLLSTWRQFLVDGDALAASASATRRSAGPRYSWLPMKFLLPPSFLVQQRQRLDGYIHGVSRCGSAPLWKLTAAVCIPDALARTYRATQQRDTGGALVVYPAPTVGWETIALRLSERAQCGEIPTGNSASHLDASECYGPTVALRVEFDPELSGVDALESTLQISIQTMDPAEYAGNKTHSKTHWDGGVSAAQREDIRLQLPRGVVGSLFVVDVRVVCAGQAILRERHGYILHKDGTSPVIGRDLLSSATVDADDAEMVAVPSKDDDDNFSGQKEKKSAARDTAALPASEETVHISLVDLYVPASAKSPSHSVHTLRHLLTYRTVSVRFLRVITVEHRCGFFADVSLQDSVVEGGSGDTCAPRSIVDLVASVDGDVDAALLASFRAAETSSPEECCEDVDYSVTPLLVNADSAAPLPVYPRVLGEGIPLLTFAVAPRQLFASHPKHHRNVIAEADKMAARGNAHIDAAIMRLRFPRLPNLLRGNFEGMPLLLRDVQTTLCPPSAPSRIPDDISVLCVEKTLANVLAGLFLLFPRSDATGSFVRGGDDQASANMASRVSKLMCGGVVYTEPTSAASMSVASRRVVLGSKRTFADVAHDKRVVLPQRISGRLAQQWIAALAYESATHQPTNHVDLAAADDAQRPMGEGGFGLSGAFDTTPWLYRPGVSGSACDGIGVIGAPLVSKKEMDTTPDGDKGEGRNFRDTHLVFQYVPIRFGGSARDVSVQGMYKMSSYGQVGRDVIFSHRVEQCQRGRDMVDYFALLLRCRRSDGGARRFPDGILKVYGNAHEPLYVFYIARASLRFQLALQWDVFRSCKNLIFSLDTEDRAADEEDKVLQKLLVLVKKIVRHVAVAAKGAPAYFTLETYVAGSSCAADAHNDAQSCSMCTINVFPIEEKRAASPTASTDAVDAEDAPQHDFEMRGNVFGRLPAWQLRLWWIGGEDLISSEFVTLRPAASSP